MEEGVVYDVSYVNNDKSSRKNVISQIKYAYFKFCMSEDSVAMVSSSAVTVVRTGGDPG